MATMQLLNKDHRGYTVCDVLIRPWRRADGKYLTITLKPRDKSFPIELDISSEDCLELMADIGQALTSL